MASVGFLVNFQELANKIITVFWRGYLKHTYHPEKSNFQVAFLPSSPARSNVHFIPRAVWSGRVGPSQSNCLCKGPVTVTCRTHQKLTGKLFFVNFLVLGLSQELLQNFSLVHAAGQERQCERVKGGHVKSVSWPRDIMKPLLPLEQSMLKLWFTDCITSPRGNQYVTNLCGHTTKPSLHSRALAPSFSRKEPG